MQKRIAILGSTGSIGKQALDVIRENPSFFEVETLTSLNNADLLIEQALEFKPNCVVIGNEKHYQEVLDALFPKGIKVFAGMQSIEQIVMLDSIEMVLSAIVGFAGLKPTLNAIETGKIVALANKESLVVAGELVTRLAAEKRVPILPVDSEHSAIFQCLAGEHLNPIEKIYLTASGGPFFGKTKDELEIVTPQEALKHPNWDMGAKITIDSASLMNKGLEVIEAHWLFGLKPEQIEVVVHPQSIIHSLVQFADGSIKAQMGLPDMRLPIQYAFSYPNRIPSTLKRFSFKDYPVLSFAEPDKNNFRCLELAYQALRNKGNSACILNAANEIAVEAFLNDIIGFRLIPETIEFCMSTVKFIQNPMLEDYILTNEISRQTALDFISKNIKK